MRNLIKEQLDIINEENTLLRYYDQIRDLGMRIYTYARLSGKIISIIPRIIRSSKHKDQEGLDKLKNELGIYAEKLINAEPDYHIRRKIKQVKKDLADLNNMTLDRFEKNPDKFLPHQQDILLKHYDITPDGITRNPLGGEEKEYKL